MNGKTLLYIDQWGNRWYAKTVKDLANQLGYSKGSARRIYRDKKDGRTVPVGYTIGRHWLEAFQPVEIEV